MQKNGERSRGLCFEDYLKSTEKNSNYDENRFNLSILSQVFSIMKKEEITNAELAKRMGVSRAYITKLFKGNCNFTIKTVTAICKALDSDVDIRIKHRK